MAVPLPLADADHHLGRLVRPARLAEHRIERLDRHLVARDHHPPGRAGLVGEIEARAFIDEALAQLELGGRAHLGGARRAGHLVERDDPVGERAGRHVGGRHVDGGDQPRIGGAGAGERGERRDPHAAGRPHRNAARARAALRRRCAGPRSSCARLIGDLAGPPHWSSRAHRR